MKTLVMKFGGTTVGTTTALTQLVSIVLTERERWDRLLLVVSALDGVTDQLLEAAHLAQMDQRRGYRRIVANLRARHLALVEHLLGPNERAALLSNTDSLLYDMLDLCQSLSGKPAEAQRAAIDAIISVGERLSARIVAALLRQNHLRSVAVDATDLIITDNVPGNATPNIALTRERISTQLTPMLSRSIIPVLTGFIGATMTGTTTTLGRGGSDYTAAILGVNLDATEVWMWTDVDGVMSADPSEVPTAESIPSLSYDEGAELAYFGVKVLHTRMVMLLRERKIPLRVRNVYVPGQPGTLISGGPSRPQTGLLAVTAIPAIGLSTEPGVSLNSLMPLVDSVFGAQTGTSADVTFASQSAQHTFACFIVPTTAGPDAVHRLQLAMHDQISSMSHIPPWHMRPVSVVTAIGPALSRSHGVSAGILMALDGIRLLASAYQPLRGALSVVVEAQNGEATVARLHEVILASRSSS